MWNWNRTRLWQRGEWRKQWSLMNMRRVVIEWESDTGEKRTDNGAHSEWLGFLNSLISFVRFRKIDRSDRCRAYSQNVWNKTYILIHIELTKAFLSHHIYSQTEKKCRHNLIFSFYANYLILFVINSWINCVWFDSNSIFGWIFIQEKCENNWIYYYVLLLLVIFIVFVDFVWISFD